MNLIKLFFEFLKIGGFAFGGGMGTLPYIYEMADRTGWISSEYIGRILAVSQVTPGPLACNIGTITGYRVGGIFGTFIANLGFILPAVCVMTICYKLLNKIKNNDKANKAIKVVRSAALAIMISSSLTLFKNTFLIEDSKVNIKNVLLAIIIYLFYWWNCSEKWKYKRINSLVFIFISAGIAMIFRV